MAKTRTVSTRTANFEGVYKSDHEMKGRLAGQCIECWNQGRAEKDEVFRTPEDYDAHVANVHSIVGFYSVDNPAE